MRLREFPRPALLPPDIDSSNRERRDDKPHDANEYQHRQAENGSHVEPISHRVTTSPVFSDRLPGHAALSMAPVLASKVTNVRLRRESVNATIAVEPAIFFLLDDKPMLARQLFKQGTSRGVSLSPAKTQMIERLRPRGQAGRRVLK